jgi:methionyl-tRNA synthetase
MENPTNPPAAPASAPTDAAGPAMIQYDDFAKVELRVATVVDCQPHPNADKLLVLQIDLGNEKRQICAGLKQYMQPADLIGKQIIVVANLAPRQMRGQVSQGMLLAATDSATGGVVVLSPASPVAPGSGVK